MKHVYLILLIVSALLTANSCGEKEAVYPDQGNDLNAAFAKSEIKTEVEAADGGVFSVEVVRGNLLDTEVTVPLTLTPGQNVPAGANFRLAESSVRFAKGENRKNVTISYDVNGMEFFETYKIVLSFTDSGQGPIFGANATSTVSFSRKLIYDGYGDGVFTSEFFGGEDIGGNPKTVEIQKSQGASYFVVKDMYANGYDIKFVMDDGLTGIVEFEDQQTGVVHPSYGMISASLVNASVSGKTISFTILYYVNAGLFGEYAETLVLP